VSRPVEVLERIARSGEAVFAFDGNDLIILWNKACERLLGRPAYQVLGRRCYDILCGRDVYGNRYCSSNCPVSSQARTHQNEELHTFLMDVPVAGGSTRRVSVTPFAISGGHPSLATIVHVLRDPESHPSALERELADAVDEGPSPRPSLRTAAGEIASLTDREQEILRKMAQGLTTDGIAAELFISPVTVRNHIARILSKLDVHTKLAAVAFAYQHGMVGPDSRTLPTLPASPPEKKRASQAASPPRRSARPKTSTKRSSRSR
jgi:DNA-binding CsgD family transcriptional regulator